MPITIVKMEKIYSDNRGFIAPLIDEDNFKVKNVVYIFSEKGAIRGNHYHKKESYWEYCLHGKFRYYQKDINDPNSKLESVVVNPTEMIFSPAGIAHAVEILEDTVILCIASRSRKQDKYLADLVKVKII